MQELSSVCVTLSLPGTERLHAETRHLPDRTRGSQIAFHHDLERSGLGVERGAVCAIRQNDPVRPAVRVGFRQAVGDLIAVPGGRQNPDGERRSAKRPARRRADSSQDANQQRPLLDVGDALGVERDRRPRQGGPRLSRQIQPLTCQAGQGDRRGGGLRRLTQGDEDERASGVTKSRVTREGRREH